MYQHSLFFTTSEERERAERLLDDLQNEVRQVRRDQDEGGTNFELSFKTTMRIPLREEMSLLRNSRCVTCAINRQED